MITSMKALFLIASLGAFLLSSSAWAAESGVLTITPITGYERVQKLSPTPHTKDQLYYGVRLLFGPTYFALEAEYTQSDETESFPANSLTVREEAQKAKVGLRSSFSLIGSFWWYLRAGGQGKQITRTKVQNGVTTVEKPAPRIDPYAGTGFSYRLQQNFSVTGGITVIFSDYPKENAKEYQTSLGFSVHL